MKNNKLYMVMIEDFELGIMVRISDYLTWNNAVNFANNYSCKTEIRKIG